MTKDFKKQSTADSAFGQYGLGWMVGGVAIGLLIGAGMYALANKGNAPNVSTATQATLSTSPAGAEAVAGTDNVAGGNNTSASLQDKQLASNEPLDASPGFSYHAVLPQLEIDVPMAVQAEQPPMSKVDKSADKKKEVTVTTAKDNKDNQKNAADAPVKSAVSTAPTGFNGFQIGSYKTADQAADMGNRLKKKGLSSRVEQASVKGETWYRVKVGPAASSDVLKKWQQTLSGMGISPLAVRM